MGPDDYAESKTLSRFVVRATPVLRIAVPASGFIVGGTFVAVGLQLGVIHFPGLDPTQYYAPAGDAFRSGGDPYRLLPDGTAFFYAPPWAAVFALVPSAAAITVLIYAANVLALRYMAGSWLAIGYLCWFPLVPWEAFVGNVNILMTAAIVAACREQTWPAVAMALAKFSTALAISPGRWRSAGIALGVSVFLTLPRLDLWPVWVERVWWATAHPLGPLVPVPFLVRLPFALALIAWQRPWSRALGAALATPSFYWVSFVMFVAPLVVFLRRGGFSSAHAPARR